MRANIDRASTKHCKQPASLAAQARTDNASGSIARIEGTNAKHLQRRPRAFNIDYASI
jgi:hypothetical protein